MNNQQNWAQTLTQKLTDQMARVQIHAAYRVHKKGGHEAAQACASFAARESLLDGGSAANAIANGVTIGMKINAEVNTVHHLSVRP